MRHLAGQQGAKQASMDEGSDLMCMRLAPIKTDEWLFWPAVYSSIDVEVNYQVRGRGGQGSVFGRLRARPWARVMVPEANLPFERQRAKTGGVTQRRLWDLIEVGQEYHRRLGLLHTVFR